MRTWFSADWHLGEKRLSLLGRPFAGPLEMLATLVVNHNALVAPNDEVIIVGDVISNSAPESEIPELLKSIGKFNGRKTVLLRGNHDRRITDEQFAPYFETIIPEGDGLEMEYDSIQLWITHYPTLARADRFNCTGHCHGAWKVQKNMINVGVDCHAWRPMPLEKVRFFYDAICHFYDQDVWVADHPANVPHIARGKFGSYFTPKPAKK